MDFLANMDRKYFMEKINLPPTWGLPIWRDYEYNLIDISKLTDISV